VQILQDALEESNVVTRESELMSIMKKALLDSTEGRTTYQQTLTNCRQHGWDLEQLCNVLVSDCHELVQTQGIADLENANFQREMQKRKIVPAQSAQVGAKAIIPSAAAGSAVPVPGTDGILKAETLCYKCKGFGHYARSCPGAKPKPEAKATKVPSATQDTQETDAPSGAPNTAPTKKGEHEKAPAGGKAPAASRAATSAFFKEEDDEYGSASSSDDETGAAAHVSETVELFRRGAGSSKKLA
jgi:hypothetical protein